MDLRDFSLFLGGAVFSAALATSLLFVHFWRRTGDRLFAWFAAAFAALTLERVLLFVNAERQSHPTVYVARLVAFLFIIVAVIDRNRRSPR